MKSNSDPKCKQIFAKFQFASHRQ
uniref:Uncharacterized protein n=1 Tax=Rhizophora mucronata TaxID=61149 RepID=A0A2P2R149_RHIMU